MANKPGQNNGVADFIAQRFHETYERLALEYGYETRPESRTLWYQVPSNNQALMIATVQYLLDNRVIGVPFPGDKA